jgi:hypothetical protein
MSAVRKISKASQHLDHTTEGKVILYPFVETSRKSILKREVALVTGFERKMLITT